MKFLAGKKNGKKITIILLVIMLFNLACPKISKADLFGEITRDYLFEPISQFLCTIADLVIEGLQSYFMGDDDIGTIDNPLATVEDIYCIKYSPGMIFSNRVPGLDVNFFSPGDYTNNGISEITKIGNPKTFIPWSDSDIDKNKKELLEENGIEYDKNKEKLIKDVPGDWDGYNLKTWELEYNDKTYQIEAVPVEYGIPGGSKTLNYVLTLYGESEGQVTEGEIKESSASQLQPIVATWYKALRAIALVGLLSVLVYIGIRILISSTGQEKAKYRKMIMDWLVAIFILFVLQYIMIFTLEITNKITEVLSVNIVGEDGQDILMTDIRNALGSDDIDFKQVFAELLIYLVLVIQTVVFTVQYLKRLLYMAFFTLISPLIALTYPLDKIKDGQAQAFTIWIREYIFNALLQPMHLLLYFIFVTSASELVSANPLYAVVAIGFIVPAEKFFRKMFGFEQASSSSPMGAVAGGALIMNAIKSMGQSTGKHATGGSSASETEGEAGGGTTPRYVPAPTDSANSSGGSGSGSGNGTGGTGGTSSGSSSGTGSGRSSNRGTRGSSLGGGGSAFGQTVNPSSSRGARSFRNGARTLAGHYVNKANGKKLLKGAGRLARKGIIGAAGALTLGTVGLAAGIATGDAGNAFKYGATGAGVGFAGANALGDKATEFEKQNRERFKEGALGTQEYNTRQSIQELTNDNDFNRVCRNIKITKKADREKLIREFHSNGIKKPEEIKKAINVRAKTGASQSEVIAAHKIRMQAERDGMKRKDIEASLKGKGVTGTELNKAMKLIDML